MVPKYLRASVSIRSVKVTFGPFQSLCSSDDACRPISSPYISTCIACSALLFGTKIYLPKTFGPFQSLCSSDDACRPISSPYISTCIACSALLFGTKIYLPKTYKPYKKRTCLIGINGVITVLPNSRLNFHRVQCKIDDLFSLGRLAPIPLTTLY